MRWMIAITAVLLAASALAQEQPSGRLIVTGEGRQDRAPDMAVITMGVETDARAAADALRENSIATRAMLATLVGAGIDGRDMQTSNLSLSPIWDNRNSSSGAAPRVVGYSVRNNVTVRVRELAVLGDILDAVVSGGANNFHGLSFGLQNPGPVQDDARRAAVVDAKRKAALYAEAAGLTLGPVLELSETGSASPQPVMLARISAEAVPVAQGEVSTVARVSMVFEIAGP